MVRLARLASECDGVPSELQEVAAGCELDWLQLDYVRPRVVTVSGRAPAELPTHASGFGEALRVLGKTLFLDPQLHIAASAGWDDAYGCVEQAAAVLVEAGCGELPMAAVRGSNLRPVLEMLVPAGVDLRNVETGARWKEMREPILAADLHVGAGPLATAMAEGARVVVAGCFDASAPLTAAAVHEHGWHWHDFQRLAGAAIAARAAAWSDWLLEGDPAEIEFISASSARWVEVDAYGSSIVDLGRKAGETIVGSVSEYLTSGTAEKNGLSPDVRPGAFSVKPASDCQLRIDGCAGQASDGCWDLEILFQSGYAAEALVGFTPQATERARRQIAAAARQCLDDDGRSEGIVTVESLGSLNSSDETGWLHLACQSRSRSVCQRFVEQTVRLIAAHPALVRFAAGRPAVHAHCGRWPARVPRDAVDIAVETRTAKEWQ